MKEKAARQQYLSPLEEKALVKYLLRMSSNGYPLPVHMLRSPANDRPTRKIANSPGKNWPQAFYKRHPELKPKRVKALDWKRHDDIIHSKVTRWFDIIGQELHDPVVRPENVYNMDKTGVMLVESQIISGCLIGS
jgi:hypothetical protein